MESIDPIVIATAGSVVVGIAVVATICMFGSEKKKVEKPHKRETQQHHVAVEEVKSEATKKPKKKSRSKKSKSSAASADESNDAVIESSVVSEKVEVPIRKVEEKVAPKVEPPKVEEEATEESKSNEKSKKPKETAEQKAARLERQKVAKAKKTEEEAAIIAASNDFNMSGPNSPLSSPYQHLSLHHANVDGWAVVEDRRKQKAVKKPAAQAEQVKSPENAAAEVPSAPADLVNAQLSIEGKKVGIIIGPKGATLRSIQEATGTELTTPKDKDAKVALVGISGPAAGVALATKIVEDLCSKGYSAVLEGEDFSEGTVSVHPMYISDIIGKQGCVRKAIQDFFDVRVSIPPGVTRDQPNNVKVGLAGQRNKVSDAKKTIKELCKYYHTAVTHPTFVHEEMDIAPALYNLIIGVRGSEIKHIQANFKVSVYIPNENSVTKSVLIVGEQGPVANARRYIQKIVDQAGRDAVKVETLTDAWTAQEETDVHEPWMEEFTHPSKRKNAGKSVPLPPGLEESSEATKAASLAAASQGAWGATVASAEGW